MKALSLHQPWASLIACGAKTIETRGWETSYRGPLAIHAARRSPDMDMGEEGPEGDIFDDDDECLVQWAQNDPRDYAPRPTPPALERWWYWLASDPIPRHPMPLGAVVATCWLVDCVPMVHNHSARPPTAHVLWDEDCGLYLFATGPSGDNELIDDQLPYGDFTPGRFAWLLADVEPVDPPVPARGRQRLWNWDQP